jgi:mannose-1-phosphate guanylyltransferase / mannose-6-phosphate isomerase
MANVIPVILSGGSGTRLWPLSRSSFPKQFLPLVSSFSMFQETVRRVQGDGFASPFIISNEDHRFIVLEQMARLETMPASIILEPQGRNTAPAVCVAALRLLADQDDAIMLVMPSDHVIADQNSFRHAVAKGVAAVQSGKLVTFGITPHYPETGYGYIQIGATLDQVEGVHSVSTFAEKPDLDTAQKYVSSGQYLWNSGIFLLSAKDYIAELECFAPNMVAACRRALELGQSDGAFWRLDAASFAASPSDSIDYAVMEKTSRAAVVPVQMGWNDVGSWSAMWDIADKDGDGNAAVGDVTLLNTHNSYVRSDELAVAVSGLDDVIVIATDDAVLVSSRTSAQDVKLIVDRLKAQSRHERVTHNTTTHRPWGSYRQIDLGDRFQVKRITVNPGQKLSLQMHHHRAEHWVVVQGTALVTRGEDTFLLFENQSTFISPGQIHRLENPGRIPLHIIEVQSGGYLGEDDIVRLNDTYGRTQQ